MTEDMRVHVGGDQLTRQRFIGAERLRSEALTTSEKFEHLSPITFEFFHLQMAVLDAFYKILYNDNCNETGSLYTNKVLLSMNGVKADDVKNTYDPCSELAVSTIDAYIVEAAMTHVGMQSTLQQRMQPTFHQKLTQKSPQMKKRSHCSRPLCCNL